MRGRLAGRCDKIGCLLSLSSADLEMLERRAAKEGFRIKP
jgi:hypothetical protein